MSKGFGFAVEKMAEMFSTLKSERDKKKKKPRKIKLSQANRRKRTMTQMLGDYKDGS